MPCAVLAPFAAAFAGRVPFGRVWLDGCFVADPRALAAPRPAALAPPRFAALPLCPVAELLRPDPALRCDPPAASGLAVLAVTLLLVTLLLVTLLLVAAAAAPTAPVRVSVVVPSADGGVYG